MSQEDKKVTGRAIGGKARSAKLTPEQRSEIARKGAIAKHEKNKVPVAIRKGNFKEDFGFDVDCYVIDNESKTALISSRGMAAALELGNQAGSRFSRFINYQYMEKYISDELRAKLANPTIFKFNPNSETHAHGYDVTILIDLCNAILEAKNAGERFSDKIAQQAQIIISASAKSGIQELVYKLAGFDSTKEQFISAFKQFVNDEAKKYEKEFPIELYEEWARLYKLEIPTRGWPWKFKTLTEEHIYYPLAASQGKLLTLLRINKEKDGDRRKKLFQFLNDIGTRALRMHLGRVLEMAESSKNQQEYEEKIEERFSTQQRLNFSDTQDNDEK